MKTLLAMGMLFLVGCACGPDTLNRRTERTESIKWTVVDTATIKISSETGLYAVTPIDLDVDWTEPEKGTFTVSCSLSATETSADVVGLGTCTISNINVNKLKVCGGSKCTNAAIRIYTTGTYAGFINTTEGYGVPFLSDGEAVGLTATNALTLDSYTIPANDRRLRNNDFTDLAYDLTVDMSNAGSGSYTVDAVIQLLLGI